MDNYNMDAKEDVRARIDIANVVSRYVKLTPAGQNQKGLCPFHKEKSPSFTVNSARGFFHCFGCGKGGDIYSFLMDIENLSFPEALERLAEEAGVELKNKLGETSNTLNKKHISRNRAIEINQYALSYFYNHTKTTPLAIDYFKNRGLTGEMVRDFRLGYAPPGWNGLIDSLKIKGVKIEEMVECGLAIQSSSSESFYDRFRDRIIFPLFDINGKPIGFAGRGIEKDAKPKYINSPETILYKKNRYLYGLDKARDSIKKEGFVIFVEGYMDFLSLYQNGVKNIVAASGTALTAEHGEIIRRFTDNVILIFDGDEAGLKASQRSAYILSAFQLDTSVTILPAGEDPDSYIKREGKDKFLLHINGSKNAFKFIIEQGIKKYGINSAQAKASIVKYASPLINQASNIIVRNDLIRTLASELDIDEKSISQSISTPKRQDNFKSDNSNFADGNINTDALINTEEGSFLHILIRKPELLKKYNEKISTEIFSDSYIKHLYSIVKEEYRKSNNLDNLMFRSPNGQVKSLFSLMMITELPSNDIEDSIEHKLKRFLLRGQKRKMHSITRAIRDASDTKQKELLLQEQQQLVKSMGSLI